MNTGRAIRAFIAVGAVTNAFAAGCVLGPGCWDRCDGNLECDVYSKSGCPTSVGCQLADRCLCSSPERGDLAAACDFTDAGAKCAAAGTSETSCNGTAGCLWAPACTGLVACSKFQDETTCGGYPNSCNWAKDCG